MPQDKMLDLMLVITIAFGIAKFKISEFKMAGSDKNGEDALWKNNIIKTSLIIFYAVYLEAVAYSAKKITYYLANDFREGANHVIWIYCLAGALIWFPRYTQGKKGCIGKKTPALVCNEIAKHITYIIITVLAFCTQELERLRISTLGTGIMVLAVYALFQWMGHHYQGKERVLRITDIFWLYMAACIYWYLGTSVYNTNSRATLTYIPISIFVTFIPMLVLLFITANLNLTIQLSSAINVIWTLVHYYVYEFRGSVLIPGDILTIGTAATVAGEYKYSINTDIWWLIMGSLILIMLAGNQCKIKVMNRKAVFRIAGTTISCIAILLWYNSDFITNMNLPYQSGWLQQSMYNSVGYTMGFIEVMKSSEVAQPDNYSSEYVETLALEYAEDTDDVSAVKPDIIVIMNEAFADIGDICELDTNIDYMEYYHSLETSKDTAVGRALVSTIGGNTCKSEYEFLTGNSQEFLPDVMAYVTEIYTDIYSVVSTLKSQGYYTMATHPNVGSNWKRKSVYECMQFDETKFIEDYENPELMREHVTDAELYRNVLSWIENRNGDEPQFVFAVTMQNHSPFAVEHLREGEELPVIRNGVDEPNEVDEYLSLIYESDKALEELVAAVDARERPTVIAMFGDHFPRFKNTDLYELGYNGTESGLAREQLEYATPYIVYANYDIDLSHIPSYLSVNYLSSFILDSCGLKLTPYDNFLLEMQENIPAINFMGMKTNEGEWYTFDEVPEEYAQWINDYNILQYNSRFGSTLPQMFGIAE